MSQKNLSLAEEQAFQLSQAAILLDEARQDRGNLALLAAALERNLETWVAFKTIINNPACTLTEAVKANLRQLAEFVAERTLQGVSAIADSTLDTMINMNLQISEGLLEGARNA